MKLKLKQLRNLVRETIEDLDYNKTMENQTNSNIVEIERNGMGELVSIAFNGNILDKPDTDHFNDDDDYLSVEIFENEWIVSTLQSFISQGALIVIDDTEEFEISEYIDGLKEDIQDKKDNPDNY